MAVNVHNKYNRLPIAAKLTDSVGFIVTIVDPSADSHPVTANVSWTALHNITSEGQNITYIVIVSYENDTAVTGQSITHPNSFLEIPGLPACASLTATLVAEKNSESHNGTIQQFSTSELHGESYIFPSK